VVASFPYRLFLGVMILFPTGNGPMLWLQERIKLPAYTRGCHLITGRVLQGLPRLAEMELGLLQIFLQHTSASLTINENADPDVQFDLASGIDRLVPEQQPWRHTLEGPDDMPAHVKSSLLGCSLLIPVTGGRLQLGTWQGIYLNEHRDQGGLRSLVLTAWGNAAHP
jgi:secondary thiamine-phosphate synthase enzyme